MVEKLYSEEEINAIFASTKTNWKQKLKYKKFLPTKQSKYFDNEYDIGDVAVDSNDKFYLIIENGVD